MRIPVPAALLVEHPAVPVPAVDGAATESLPTGDAVSVSSLSRRERFRAALQLTAAASLLAEFDLWPGRAALRAARFRRTPSGLWASLARFPVPMSRVYSRLGGGEGAAATTRAAVLEAISGAVELTPASIDHLKGEPGFFLEAAIARQLRELKQPLDASDDFHLAQSLDVGVAENITRKVGAPGRVDRDRYRLSKGALAGAARTQSPAGSRTAARVRPLVLFFRIIRTALEQ